MKSKLLKLAKMLLNFKEENGLIYEGVLGVGTEVFIEKDGEMIPAPSGEYGNIIVEDGIVKEIKEEIEVEVKETEEEEIDKDAIISEKDAEIDRLKATIAELEAKINELQNVKDEEFNKQNKPADSLIKDVNDNAPKGIARYFNI